eukprot:15746201-Heterocapsa_arctica.AAC.1
MLLDSGSFLHVCPPDFAPEIALWQDGRPPRAVTASGQPLRCYGHKKVLLSTNNGVLLNVDFAVMDVSQPILS